MLRAVFSGAILAYLIGWFRYLVPAHPKDKPKISYTDRLDFLIDMMWELKQVGDTINDRHEIPKGWKVMKGPVGEFPYELWKTLSDHMGYTILNYNTIGRFKVSVWEKGPMGMNMPGYPGIIINAEAFWNPDTAFCLDILLHEAYHDFYIGHGPKIDSIDDHWDPDIPLRRGLVSPNLLFACGSDRGAFMRYIDFLRICKNEDGETLWEMVEKTPLLSLDFCSVYI